MKKILAFVIFIVICISLCGCGNNYDDSDYSYDDNNNLPSIFENILKNNL